MVERLGPQAEALGRGFGVKFSNTLVVENHKSFFPGERAPDVPFRAAAAPARHRSRQTVPADFRRSLPHLVLRRHRRGQFRRRGGARPAAGHRLHRSPEARRLPARLALSRRSRQAHGGGRRAGHRQLRLARARPGRGRARRALFDGRAPRCMPRRASARRRLARRRGRRLPRLGFCRAAASTPRSTPSARSPIAATAPPRTPRRRKRSAAPWCCSTA